MTHTPETSSSAEPPAHLGTSTSPPVAEDPTAQAIVAEELQLFSRVSAALSALAVETPGAPSYDETLITLRDQIAEAKPEDLPALVEEMTRTAALAQRYGQGRNLPVDPASPYFAHLRLAEGEKSRDILLGKRGYIDRRQGVQIVDWRNAPISRIYYRYDEGDDYEERFGSRPLEGIVAARRAITIADTRLQRIACPQGTFATTPEGTWIVARPVGVPELAGGQGKAARPPALRHGDKQSRLGIHGG